jgi:DNA repair protein RecN (Recombination protein N)
VIELEVDATAETVGVGEWCRRNNVPPEFPMILRRQLEPNGRSRSFVNDTPVLLEQLRSLGEGLVHIHSQHHTLLLHSPAFQLGLLDHYSGQGNAVRLYSARYQAWRGAAEELGRLRAEEAKAQGERDYLQFQLDELLAARLVPGEALALEQALARAEHAGELLGALNALAEGIDGEGAVGSQLAEMRHSAAKAARVDPAVQTLVDRLNSASIELKDIAGEAARLAGEVSMDPREANSLRERSDLLTRLQVKHQVKDAEDLLALQADLEQRIGRIGSLADAVQQAEKKAKALRAEVEAAAEAISKQRLMAMDPLAGQVSAQLRELGMPHAQFRFQHVRTEPGPTGIDHVQALFSANKDRAPEPLEKVASGGELGRVMLALISLAAASKELPTVIFDEIDTGVSGEVAHRVGALLKAMGRERQVVAISHLPQIASKADTHLLVTKDHQAEQVRSAIRVLDAEERVQALARMLSGRKTTKAALENARELLRSK